MDEILDEVKKLSVAELRTKLIDHGEKVGPITANTQFLFQKRLAKILYQSQHPNSERDEERQNDVANNNTIIDRTNTPETPETVENKDVTEPKPAVEPSAFFGVCLPHGIDRKETEGLCEC